MRRPPGPVPLHLGRPGRRLRVRGRGRVAWGFAAWLLLIAGAAVAWRWTPLAQTADLASLAALAQRLAHAPLAPLWVLGAYLLAAVVAFPITVLIVATALVYGSAPAFGFALVGSLGGAALSFWIGRVLGRHLVGRFAGPRLKRLDERLGRSGLLAMLAVRVVPVAPFTVVNVVAGASRIRWRDFLLGTLLGMLPGILAITVFSDLALQLLHDPSPREVAVMGALGLLAVATLLALRRWLAGRGALPVVVEGPR